jgi:hypothetical protein
MCTGNEICTYGSTVCGCANAPGSGREWVCRTSGDAANDPDCPATKPTPGSSCADAGARTVCRYGVGDACICDLQEMWRCQ